MYGQAIKPGSLRVFVTASRQGEKLFVYNHSLCINYLLLNLVVMESSASRSLHESILVHLLGSCHLYHSIPVSLLDATLLQTPLMNRAWWLAHTYCNKTWKNNVIVVVFSCYFMSSLAICLVIGYLEICIYLNVSQLK
jgi:hypothetical protein